MGIAVFTGVLVAIIYIFSAAAIPQSDRDGLAVYVIPTFCLFGLTLLVLGYVVWFKRPYVGLSIMVVVSAVLLGLAGFGDIFLSGRNNAGSIVGLILVVLGVVGWFKYVRRNYFDDSPSIQIQLEHLEGFNAEVYHE